VWLWNLHRSCYLELWGAEAKGVVGALIPGRCREVMQRESLMSGLSKRSPLKEPREKFPYGCVSLFTSNAFLRSWFACSLSTAAADVTKIGERWRSRADSEPRGRTQRGGTTSLLPRWRKHFHHQSAICWVGGAGQLVLWIRPPQSRDRLLPNTRVSPSLLASHYHHTSGFMEHPKLLLWVFLHLSAMIFFRKLPLMVLFV